MAASVTLEPVTLLPEPTTISAVAVEMETPATSLYDRRYSIAPAAQLIALEGFSPRSVALLTMASTVTAPPRTVAPFSVTVPLPSTTRTYGVGTKRSFSARRTLSPGVNPLPTSTSASSLDPDSSRIEVPESAPIIRAALRNIVPEWPVVRPSESVWRVDTVTPVPTVMVRAVSVKL